jgi:hypothetical protein
VSRGWRRVGAGWPCHGCPPPSPDSCHPVRRGPPPPLGPLSSGGLKLLATLIRFPVVIPTPTRRGSRLGLCHSPPTPGPPCWETSRSLPHRLVRSAGGGLKLSATLIRFPVSIPTPTRRGSRLGLCHSPPTPSPPCWETRCLGLTLCTVHPTRRQDGHLDVPSRPARQVGPLGRGPESRYPRSRLR